jgi:hypothetical protein
VVTQNCANFFAESLLDVLVFGKFVQSEGLGSGGSVEACQKEDEALRGDLFNGQSISAVLQIDQQLDEVWTTVVV